MSVVFAGFSANAMADRINDAQAKMVITSDGLNRGAKQVKLKGIVDKAVSKLHFHRIGHYLPMHGNSGGNERWT